MKYAHSAPENALKPRVVYVCAECGWWKAESFTCRHMVDGADGEPAYRDHAGQRTTFYLWGDVQREIAKREPSPSTAA